MDRAINKQRHSQIHVQDKELQLIGMQTKLTESSHSESNVASSKSNMNTVKANNSSKSKIGWINIISSYEGYVAFMNHLAKEFSIENLLFVQEVEYLYILSYYLVCLIYTQLICRSCFFFHICETPYSMSKSNMYCMHSWAI